MITWLKWDKNLGIFHSRDNCGCMRKKNWCKLCWSICIKTMCGQATKQDPVFRSGDQFPDVSQPSQSL